MSRDGEDIVFAHLVVRYLDDNLSPEETRQLNQRLREDPASQERFVEICLHAKILGEAGGARSSESPAARATHVRGWAVGGAVAALAAAAIVLVVWRGNARMSRSGDGAARRAGGQAQVVAVLTAARGARWGADGSSPRPGDTLAPGTVQLVAGEAEIDFVSGAKVLMTAPATLDLISPLRGFVREGAVSARVGVTAVGFTLGARDMAVVDLGTEFGMDVSRNQPVQVEVVRGKVEASLLDSSGSSRESAVIEQADRVSVAPGWTRLEPATAAASRVPRLPPFDPPPFPVPAAYADAVRAARPVGYWRFETIEGRRVRDEGTAAGGHEAEVVGEVELRRTGDNGYLLFSPNREEGFLQVKKTWTHLCDGDYSMEVWLAPESFHVGSVLGLVAPRVGDNPFNHFALIEIEALPNALLHRPGAVRLLHRWPPRLTGGMNAFSDTLRPGVWHHLVGTRRGARMTLYVDGVVSAETDVAADRAPRPLEAIIGKLGHEDTGKNVRRYCGALDEVAVYDRALSGEEVRRHFALMKGGAR